MFFPPLSVVELRQYTLKGGQRDRLIELFEREFVASQNALGAYVLGTFRDLDDPDRFVWLRGFESMAARAPALETFYTGPVWRAHREAANATMIDSDNVLLLRPATDAWRPAGQDRGAVVTLTIHYLGSVAPWDFTSYFEARLRPRLQQLGAMPTATFLTETAPNNFPRLPVREGERVFAWMADWPDVQAADAFAARFASVGGWRDGTPEAILPALMRKPERLRLAPTAASRIGRPG